MSLVLIKKFVGKRNHQRIVQRRKLQQKLHLEKNVVAKKRNEAARRDSHKLQINLCKSPAFVKTIQLCFPFVRDSVFAISRMRKGTKQMKR